MKATVVMPKQAARAAAPAPVPLSQVPLYLQRQLPGYNIPIVTSRDSAAVQEVCPPPCHLRTAASKFVLLSCQVSQSVQHVPLTLHEPAQALAAAKAAAARLGIASPAMAGGGGGQRHGHDSFRQRPPAAPQSAATWRDLLDGDSDRRRDSEPERQSHSSSRRDRWDQKSR